MSKLGQFVKIKTGKLDANASSENGEYPFFTCAVEPLHIDTYSYDCECVLVAGNGDLNVKYYNGKFDAYQRTYIIESKDKSILSIPYLYFFLDKYVETLRSQSIGGVIKYIKLGNLTEADLPVPSLYCQQEIVSNLKKSTRLIDLCNAILEKLDLLVKARFVEMFGNIATEKYRYETKKLGDVAFVGSSHRVFTTEFVEKGIPFYRGTEIGELANGFTPKDPYYISEEHYKILSNDETKPKYGDLLMPSICNKGQVWMVDTEEPFYYKDGRVLCISANRNIYNTRYLQHFLRKKTEIEYSKIGSGSTFAEFKIFQLKNIDVLTPPIELQNQFADFVEQTDKSKSAVKQVLEKAETLKKALMQEYFG
ncbi:MAG: restriction endonuclease subunit S [Ruminococcus sp.]|nr:restriction endonuclease subunit S [Ruminococcus sp.]